MGKAAMPLLCAMVNVHAHAHADDECPGSEDACASALHAGAGGHAARGCSGRSGPAIAAAAAREGSRSTFHRWLGQQKGRNDPIGALAGDVLSDKEFPVTAKTLAQVRRYMQSKWAAEEALKALTGAWAEFKSANP